MLVRGVSDVARRFGDALLRTHAVSDAQRRVLRNITRCQTAAAGGHMLECTNCGERVPQYNSCRDRHCPQCSWGAQCKWIEARQARILPVSHFHTVFTLPEELRPLVQANARELYGLLFEVVAATLHACAANPKWLGALPGFTLVLHTWNRQLQFHPHVHGVITAGGLTAGGAWKSTERPGRKSFLFPVKAMSRIFRARFLDGLNSRLGRGELVVPPALEETLLDRLRAAARKPWIVYAKRPFAGARHVYRYLGSYTHRVGISNARMLELTDDDVRFRARGGQEVTVSGVEFLRRFLLHVLPHGFTRIRHYGLLAASNVNTLWKVAYAQVAPKEPAPARCPTPETPANGDASDDADTLVWHLPRCPRCATFSLVSVEPEPAKGRDTS